jgi:hypothetical protein
MASNSYCGVSLCTLSLQAHVTPALGPESHGGYLFRLSGGEGQGNWNERYQHLCALVRHQYLEEWFSLGSLQNPATDTFEFQVFLDWQLFLDTCKDIGLWVLFCPGQS